MKKNKEEKMNSRVNISMNILPFGEMRLEIPGGQKMTERQKTKLPIYTTPLTTVEKVRLSSDSFSVPKTTVYK